jgi:hypothetical protein
MVARKEINANFIIQKINRNIKIWEAREASLNSHKRMLFNNNSKFKV